MYDFLAWQQVGPRLTGAVLLLFAAALPATAASPAATPAESDSSVVFVRQISQTAMEVLGDDSMSESQRRERLERFMADSFMLQQVAKYASGPHWDTMSAGQQEAYSNLFGRYVLTLYSGQLGSADDHQMEITESVPVDSGDRLVKGWIQGPDGKKMRCDWQVRETGGGYRVVDVVVDGISLTMMQRSVIGSMMQRHGVENTIQRMQQVVTSMQSAKAN